MQQDIKKFQKTVWDFYKRNKRSLPWRETKDPYKILVSEIMLQQTQAERVMGYYRRFLKKYPTIRSLAKASFRDIYPLWQGLGYNRRALALQKLAKEVRKKYHGKLPTSPMLLEELPGIGPYTARAVSIFADSRPLTCIETNIRRVFIHHFFSDQDIVTDAEILPLLELALPKKKSREWHWALMDYGAYLKTQITNPNRKHKHYAVQSQFKGSLRQARGAILRVLAKGTATKMQLVQATKKETKRTKEALENLVKEGIVQYSKAKKIYYL